MARESRRAHRTTAKSDIAVAATDEVNNLMTEVAQIASMALNAAGLAIGVGSAAAVLIANTVTYLINGVFKSKATAEVAFTATTHDIAADAAAVQEAVYLVCLDAAGTATLVMGEIASGAGAAVIPDAPADKAVIGHVRIAVDAGATPFDASTDLLSAGHLTVTYTDTAFVAPGVLGQTIRRN